MSDGPRTKQESVLLELRDLTVVHTDDGVQINVGKAHDFRSESLTVPEMMRLAGLLRLAAEEADDAR